MIYRRRRDEIEFKECPYCGNTRWNFTVNPSKGVWHCWACDRGGSLKDLPLWYFLGNTKSLDDLTDAYETADLSEKEGTLYYWLHFIPFEKEHDYLFTRWHLTYQDANRFGLYLKKDTSTIILPLLQQDQSTNTYYERLQSGRWFFHGKTKADFFYLKLADLSSSTVALTEGIMDAVKLYSLGVNVLPLCGLNLYYRWFKILTNFFDTILLVLDNDEPGQRATKQLINKLYRKFNLYIVDLSPYKDIGEMPKEEARKAIENKKKIGIAERILLKWS